MVRSFRDLCFQFCRGGGLILFLFFLLAFFDHFGFCTFFEEFVQFAFLCFRFLIFGNVCYASD